MKIPRIASLLIRRSRGGFVDVPLRAGGFHRVDTVPSHAKVDDTPVMISAKGVVLPIRRPS